MAVKFDGAGGCLTRTTNLPSITNFTICGRIYVSLDQDQWFVSMNDSNPDTTAGLNWQSVGSGGVLNLISAKTGFSVVNTGAFGSRWASATWAFFYMQCSGSGANLLTAGWIIDSGTSFVTAATTLTGTPAMSSLKLGTDSYGDPFNGRMAAIKVYDAVLTNTELLAERQSWFPARTANLNGFYPLIDSGTTNVGKDLSTNGRNFTNTATLTIEANPPGIRRSRGWVYAD